MSVVDRFNTMSGLSLKAKDSDLSVALDAVDADWLRDTLSDDDIVVPEEHELPMDESEVDTRDALDPARAKKHEKWDEKQLELFDAGK